MKIISATRPRSYRAREGCASSPGRFLFVLAVLAVFLSVVMTSRAEALTLPPPVEEALSDGRLRELAYRNGAVGSTPTCGATCSQLVQQQRAAMPNEAAGKALRRELVKTGGRIGVLPKIGALLKRFSPHATAFGGGLLIGGAINRKWLRINLPATSVSSGPQWLPPPDHTYWADYFAEGNATIGDGFLVLPTMPFDGYRLRNETLAMHGQFDSHGAGIGNCLKIPSPVAGDWTVLHYQWSTACQTGVPLFKSLYLLSTESLVDGPIEDYDAEPRPPESNTNYPGVPDPGSSVVQQRLREQLESGEYPTLVPWLCAQLGGDCEDPTGQLVKVPVCRGDSYTDCQTRLEAKGLTAQRVALDFDSADPTVPAERVVRTDPAKQAPAGSHVTVYVNPIAAEMPVVIPAIEPGETYEDYADRLRELELQPTREDATEITMDYGPDGAISTRPGTGARTHTGSEVVVVTRPRRQRCDLSDPTDEYMVGAGQQSMDLFTGDPPRYPMGANPIFLTPRNLLNPSTTLRWGTTSAQAAPDLWDGFGYRHIAAKHGWSPADEAATRDVLTSAQPVPIPNRGYDRWQFAGTPYPSLRDGRACVRLVIVDYGIRPGNTQPEGIVTSFGRDPL